ncbi:MAG: hypothetical protein JO244_03980, partial [Solirubrobacterales bacterium]|nr:hypothetical protein [Solirubrobacterales bacterium]
EVRLAEDAPAAGIRALTADPGLAVLVRPDGVVAAVEPRYRRPRVPWYIPVRGVRGYAAAVRPPVHHDAASPVPAAR